MAQFISNVAVSPHAVTRCQQRGVRKAVLSMLLEHWDQDVPVGGGRTSVTVSRKGVARLKRQGHAPAMMDLVSSLAAVLDGDGRVVTTLHVTCRRYRRAWT